MMLHPPYAIFQRVNVASTNEEADKKIDAQGEKNTNTASGAALRMANSLRAAGNTALKPFLAAKKFVFAFTQSLMAFKAKFNAHGKTKSTSTPAAPKPPSDEEIKKNYTDEKNLIVTPWGVMSYLTNDGGSDRTGAQAGYSKDKAMLVKEYFLDNADSTLFSSDNMRIEIINGNDGDELSPKLYQMIFRKPIIISPEQKISEFIIDGRPGTMGEFRGITAKERMETLTFTSLNDLCGQLNDNPAYNFKAKQAAIMLVGQLNNFDEPQQAEEYLKDCHANVKAWIGIDLEKGGKYCLKLTSKQEPTSGNGAGAKTHLGVVQGDRPPIPPKPLYQGPTKKIVMDSDAFENKFATSMGDGIATPVNVRQLIKKIEDNNFSR